MVNIFIYTKSHQILMIMKKALLRPIVSISLSFFTGCGGGNHSTEADAPTFAYVTNGIDSSRDLCAAAVR